MRTCSVEDCNSKHYGGGYCNRHYQQFRTYGKIISMGQRVHHKFNQIDIINDICWMKLYNIMGEEVAETIFDVIYKEYIENYKWHINSFGYVISDYRDKFGEWQQMSLHAAIIYLSDIEVPDNHQIDHHDGNTLNNLEDNLRICTFAQNSHNGKIRINNTSGWKGVYWHKNTKKWMALIIVNYKPIFLGYFDIKEDAAKAYNNAATKYFGEFARLNIIP